MTRTARPLVPTALALLLLSACALPGASPSQGIDHPTAREQVVLRMSYEGGFVPAEFVFTSFPTFQLMGDGTVIVPGAQIDIFPGPALPAVQTRRLSEAGVQAVLEAVAATRQFGADAEWRGAANSVADAPDTVFTLNAEDREVTVAVYALGFVGPGQALPGIGADELAAHQVLGSLAERLQALDSWIPAAGWAESAWKAYQPEAMRLLVRNADADPPDESGLPNQELPWPIDGDAATFGEPVEHIDGSRCGVVSGDDAQAWYTALSGANQLTRWLSGEHRYQVTARLLLPDEEETCPSLG